MHLGSLESTQEPRVALGYASSNSHASLMLSKLHTLSMNQFLIVISIAIGSEIYEIHIFEQQMKELINERSLQLCTQLKQLRNRSLKKFKLRHQLLLFSKINVPFRGALPRSSYSQECHMAQEVITRSILDQSV